MLIHTVLLSPAPDAAEGSFAEAMMILEEVADRLPGLSGFVHGPNRDFEGKSQAYPYGFTCLFDDEAAMQAYVDDPEHQRAGAMLVANCAGGADGIFVSDLEV
ncbi:Dabb family protein [Rhodobacterales bacterium HKCCE4037]|nr:Dabb family protein [Rhodobacterales bacterium HKCCE4037]